MKKILFISVFVLLAASALRVDAAVCRQGTQAAGEDFSVPVFGSDSSYYYIYGMEESEKCYYTNEELGEFYRQSYEAESGRRNKIIFSDGRYMVEFGFEMIEVPRAYIDAVLEHIEQAKKSGYYDYLFGDDFGHGHVGMPQAHFEKEYAGLSVVEARKKSLYDPKLMHLCHSREILEPEDPKHCNRNFIGYFNGQPIRLIHPKKENSGHTVFDYDREEMAEYDAYIPLPGGIVYFRAHKDGLFSLKDGTRLDIDI